MAERYAVSECSLVFLIFYLFLSSLANKMAHPPAKGETVVCLATAFSYFAFLISFDINVNINLDMYTKGHHIYTRIANCKLLEKYLFRVSQNSWQVLWVCQCCNARIGLRLALRVAHLFEESRIRIWLF